MGRRCWEGGLPENRNSEKWNDLPKTISNHRKVQSSSRVSSPGPASVPKRWEEWTGTLPLSPFIKHSNSFQKDRCQGDRPVQYWGVPQYTGMYWGVPWCTGGTSSALQCCFLFRSRRKHCGPMDAFFFLPISISVSFTVETPFTLTRFSLSHRQHSVQFPASCVWVRTFYLMTKWRQKRLPSLGPGLDHVLTAVG